LDASALSTVATHAISKVIGASSTAATHAISKAVSASRIIATHAICKMQLVIIGFGSQDLIPGANTTYDFLPYFT
jgi:hypothetical protein